ncbi:MAG TPA: tail fiber domain-containing protein, partial [Verrucomicrobiae bacterium]|nr:tail fiber domain-containing protein [Verrucomicrobiae bacterium]
HLSYFSQATGRNLRPWSWLIYKSSTNPAMVDRIEHSIATDKLSFTSNGGQNQWMVFQPKGYGQNSGGEISLIGPTAFVFLQNGYSPFIQLNNAGWSRSLIFLDANNHMRVGADGDPLSLNEKLMWENDGLYDIGITNSNRPRDLFLARNAVIGGSVGVGVANPAYTLQVNGSVAGVGPYLNLSDARYKENVATITNALAKVVALRGVSFNWRQGEKNSYAFDDSPQLGVIAQEVKQVLPEAVSRASNGDYSVAYGEIVPVLLQAIKEQQVDLGKMNKALQAKDAEVQTLTARLDRLEQLVSSRSVKNVPADAFVRQERGD